MADLVAKFRLVDEISDKLDNMAESGQNLATQWEQAGEAANTAFEGIATGVSSATSSVDGIASSIDELQKSMNSAADSADTLMDIIEEYGNAARETAEQIDYWTNAVGNYNKSLSDAVYTTEEFVEQGYKNADALQEQEQMFEHCEKSTSYLSKSIEASVDVYSALNNAMENASEIMSKISDNEKVSTETKEELAQASETAAQAMKELAETQTAAEQAMADYDAVIDSGTNILYELEKADGQVACAAENLAEANKKASDATEELSKVTEKAAEEQKNSWKKVITSIENMANALEEAGITDMVKNMAVAVYELVNDFSEAESAIVKETGSSGEALDSLTESMMNAYAASKSGSLDDTAGAIGEINTRLGLTDGELTTVTGQFLDFANITGTNVVGSIQKVTKIMNKWGVEGNEVENTLDKLAYAGQISGISVDTLSNNLITGAASFQEMGLSLENTISMLAQFELYGINGTTAIIAMRTAVKNFSQNGLDAQTALQSVISEIANMENATDATTLAIETFGSRAGVDMANAIRSGAITVDTLNNSLDVAQGTLSRTAASAQTLDQKWTQASNNIKSAFTKAIQPTLDGISSAFASVVNNIGTFLNEHPAVTKAITAIGIGLGVVTLGIAGVAIVSLKTIPAVAALGTAINAAIWPITLVALAIAAVTAGVLLLVDALAKGDEATAGMTATTREQYYELQDLNAEYEEACEKYGETSEEALRLKYQVDELSTSFEGNRQTLEEFTAEVDTLCKSVDTLWENYDKGMSEIKAQETGTLALIKRYEELATQASLTSVQEKELETITKKLSETYPELALQFDNATSNAEDYVKAIEAVCKEEAKRRRQEQVNETYIEALMKQTELENGVIKAKKELNTALGDRNKIMALLTDENSKLSSKSLAVAAALTGNIALAAELYAVPAGASLWQKWTTDIDDYQEALDNATAKYDENQEKIAEIKKEWQSVIDAQREAMENATTDAEAVSIAYESVKDDIKSLCEAYDEVYEEALKSFGGQFDLFDEASTKTEEFKNATVKNAQEALESQIKYWDEYKTNLQTLTDYSSQLEGDAKENFDALVTYASDSSEKAQGFAASMAKAIKEGDTEAITKLASTAAEVDRKQKEVSNITADFAVGFSQKMDEIGERANKLITEEMNLEEEAEKSATSTINGYIETIKNAEDSAAKAAKTVASAVTSELAKANTTINVTVKTNGSVQANANGTTNAASVFLAGENGPELVARPAAAYAVGTTNSSDYFIAGENGPELIVGEQGSTVFPTSETDRLIAALSEKRRPLQIIADSEKNDGNEQNSGDKSASKKQIDININGNGTIGVNSGVDKETVVALMFDYMKPVLLSLVQQEMFEEGDGFYDY